MSIKTSHSLNNRKLKLTLLVAMLAIALIVGAVCGAVQLAQGASEPYHHIGAELTVETVYSDYDTKTIKKALSVVGYTSETDTVGAPLSADDYDVTFSGALTAGETATVTVTYGGCDPVELQTPEVVEAVITPTIIVPNYTLSGNYYVNGEGYDAFVQGMTAEQVEQRLAVALVSNNPHAETTVLPFDGTTVTWTTSAPDFGSAEGTVNLPVNISLSVDGYDTPATATINFNTLREYALVLSQNREGQTWQQPDDLSSNTPISSLVSSLQGYVYISYKNVFL